MNEQQLFWSNEYAHDYVTKNSQFDEHLGVRAWQQMLRNTDKIDTVLEAGCNIGRNIGFLQKLIPDAKKSVIEVSDHAFNIVTKKYDLEFAFNGAIVDAQFPKRFDLVFTMGVLIHIHPDDLLENLSKLFNFSEDYLLFGEYFNRTPVMVEYQGRANKLFKRDFAKLFVENFPVRVVDYGFLWGREYDAAGFDDITWFLFKKNRG